MNKAFHGDIKFLLSRFKEHADGLVPATRPLQAGLHKLQGNLFLLPTRR